MRHLNLQLHDATHTWSFISNHVIKHWYNENTVQVQQADVTIYTGIAYTGIAACIKAEQTEVELLSQQ